MVLYLDLVDGWFNATILNDADADCFDVNPLDIAIDWIVANFLFVYNVPDLLKATFSVSYGWDDPVV